ncbi:MAG TPA: methionine synthase [Actinomycetota bacterium]|jgi:5-methyltetrahydropteroyltriglutamate--homocysteine methyltransferase
MTEGLWATQVGSLPKPPEILAARSDHAKGRITRAELRGLERTATEDWVRFQDEIGIDVIVDGEQYRGDMVAFFAEELEGFRQGGLVRSYGNRYYRKPVVTGELRRTHPITLEWWEFAQSLTERPVKGMLTGPYTICDWSFDEHYDTREDLVMALAEIVRQEALDLAAAGAKFIQIDEPAVSTRMDELELAIKALGVVTGGLDDVHTITHICYGDFHHAYPKMLELPVDQIDLETTNSNFDLLEEFRDHPFTKSIGLGVVDSHSHRIESADEVANGIRRSLQVIPAERTFVDPDCGLKTRTVDEAKRKLRVVVEGTRRVREEVGLA